MLFRVAITKKSCEKKDDRIDMLSAIIALNVKSYIPPSMIEDEDFHHWHCQTSAFSEKPKPWTMDNLADSFC